MLAAAVLVAAVPVASVPVAAVQPADFEPESVPVSKNVKYYIIYIARSTSPSHLHFQPPICFDLLCVSF